jgi:hypothetical protein
MPFTPRTFQPIGGQSYRGGSNAGTATPGGPQVFSYRTEDAAAVVDTADYFLAVRTLLEVGDLIWRVTVNGSGVVQSMGFHAVLQKTATSIDVGDASVVATTDTD